MLVAGLAHVMTSRSRLAVRWAWSGQVHSGRSPGRSGRRAFCGAGAPCVLLRPGDAALKAEARSCMRPLPAALLTPRSGCGAPPSQPKQKLARASPGGYRRSGRALFLTMRLAGSIISGGPVDFSWEPGFWPGFRFWLCGAWLPAGRWVAWVHQHMGWQGGASTWFNCDGVSSGELYKWRLRIDIA